MSKYITPSVKKTFKQLLIVTGLTILGLTIFNVAPVFAQGLISPGDVPGRIAEQTGGATSARQLILTIVNFFLGFLGLLSVIMIIYGGFMYVTAGGAPEGVDKAKKIIMYAVIGIIIILLSFAIVNTVLQAGTGQEV